MQVGHKAKEKNSNKDRADFCCKNYEIEKELRKKNLIILKPKKVEK